MLRIGWLREARRKASYFKSFRMNIRANVRALWKGYWTPDQFDTQMRRSLEVGYTAAWYEGAKEMGVLPDELTAEEIAALNAAIAQNSAHIERFAQTIREKSQANGGKLTPLLKRSDMWVNRYHDVKNQARLMAGADQKLKWVLGNNIDHCRSCLKQAGRVYRGSIWTKYGVRTQSPNLACGGWNCHCDQIPTDEPVTPGRPPSIP